MEGKELREERIKKGNKRDIVKMSFPMQRVEDTIASYRYSKIYTSSYTNFPNEDECSHQAYMNKVFALRQLDMAEKRLAAKRIEAKATTKKLDQRWLELHDGQRALKENFARFDEFMKENQEKRERASRKIQEEINLQNDRRDMLQKLEHQMEYYKKIQTTMVKKIKEYRLYEDYLMRVVETSIDYKNVSAVLNRFQALTESKHASARKHEGEVVALEKARTQMSKLMEEKSTALLGLRSVCGGLNSRFEGARVDVLAWESTLHQVRRHILQEYVQTRSVLRAATQLHRMMCRRQNNAAAPDAAATPPADFEAKMQFIKHTLTQLHWLRHVKFAGIKDTHEEPYENRQPAKAIVQQATEEEEERAVKEMGKSRLSIFAYLLYENKLQAPKKTRKRNNK